MTPLVSVVIPVYNAQSTIIQTIQSVINQTYTNIELILIDDGSKDNSNSIMKDYIANSDRNIKLVTKENGGVSSARNRGIDEATGEFIAFLDSDDEWLPEKIATQMTVFRENPNIDCLGTNMNQEVHKKMFGVQFERLTKITPRLMLLKNFLCIQTTLTKKAVIDDIGYFYTDQDNEDSNMMIRVANKYNSYLLNEPFVLYGNGKPVYGHSGLNSRLWEMEKGELKNVSMAVRMKIIRPIEYPLFVGFSLLKYYRRVLVTFFRRIC